MNNDHYQTSDLGLAAALLTYGFELVGINKTDPRRVVFSFLNSGDLNNVVDSYWNGNLRLSVLRYFENTKLLKSRIYGS
jgi:hypothetical protein